MKKKLILRFGFFNELQEEEIQAAIKVKADIKADHFRFIPKNGALKENTKKFSDRLAMLKEKLDRHKKEEVYYDPIEENVIFTDFQVCKFFRNAGFEVVVFSKESELEKEVKEQFECVIKED